MLPVERKACYDVVNAFLSRLELIWLTSRLKISKTLCFWQKALRVSGLNLIWSQFKHFAFILVTYLVAPSLYHALSDDGHKVCTPTIVRTILNFSVEFQSNSFSSTGVPNY